MSQLASRANQAGRGQWSRRQLLTLGVVAALWRPGSALAEAADFLQGATLRILIPNSTGSGQDLAARTFAKHLQLRLPETVVVAENHTKANGRVAGLMAWEAEPDGLTLVFLNSNLLYAEILGEEELPYSLTGFSWLGSLSVDRRVMLVGQRVEAADLASLQARDKPLLQAADAANSSHYQAALLVNALAGTWIRPVTGYNSSARALALIRGEVDCLLGTLDNMTAVLAAGAGRIVLRLNDCDLPPEHGAVPLLRDHLLHPGRGGVIDMIEGQSQMGRSVATTPGVPADRLAVLRALFQEVAADPGFVAEASANELLVRPTSGDSIAALVADLLAQKEHYARLFRDALTCGQRRADTGEAC